MGTRKRCRNQRGCWQDRSREELLNRASRSCIRPGSMTPACGQPSRKASAQTPLRTVVISAAPRQVCTVSRQRPQHSVAGLNSTTPPSRSSKGARSQERQVTLPCRGQRQQCMHGERALYRVRCTRTRSPFSLTSSALYVSTNSGSPSMRSFCTHTCSRHKRRPSQHSTSSRCKSDRCHRGTAVNPHGVSIMPFRCRLAQSDTAITPQWRVHNRSPQETGASLHAAENIRSTA